MNRQRLMGLVGALMANRNTNIQQILLLNEEFRSKIVKHRRDVICKKRLTTSFQNLFRGISMAAGQGAIMSLQALPVRIRRIGRKHRTDEWWEHTVLQTFDEEQWLENFRMRRDTFFQLVENIRQPLKQAKNCVLPGLSVEKKVAIAIYKLASVWEYRIVGNPFGVHKSTVCECLHAVVRAINSRMMVTFLSFPRTKEDCDEIAQGFEQKYGMPQVIGAVDGSHIHIPSPEEGAADFHNRKGWSSLVLRVVVDHRRCFRAVTCQHPGSVHDAVVLRDSDLYRNSHRLIPVSDRNFHGEIMPYVIIGDAAYPLLNWLVNDYRIEQTPKEVSFNLYLHKARIVVKHAFGPLKGRWRILYKRSELDVYFMPEVILACCILHNFVEIAKDPFMVGWLNVVQDANLEFQQPNEEIPRGNDGGQEVRDRMRAYLEEHYPLLNRG